MTEKELIKIKMDVAAVLVTLLEVDAPAPETSIYLAMNMDHGHYENVKSVMVGSKLVICKGHTLRLTNSGREMATKLKPIYDQAKTKEMA